ncbi:hypothetical protein RJ639_045179 [Escallonia herrerae]|uniref:Reverse transcriptase/retrotransposon-derived protein RNase H-like domain-containing protein n=1 Tax=Escallonia herrerae TaxID=1293975 RepID=A0AA89B0S3_9ASTE|nr:hypothetical protein RJ639_045179 [Escallonia herrerae]
MGRIAALNCFLSKSAERCLPFFKALKNIKDFEWTAECQASFEALKEYLASPPLLSKPVVGEELFLYLAVTDSAVNAVLVREQDSKKFPVYYVSKSHTVTVLTDKPLRRILHKPDLSGRLVPWSVELGEFDIQYKPRPSIKGQALVDFIVECTLLINDANHPSLNKKHLHGHFTWMAHPMLRAVEQDLSSKGWTYH